MSDGADVVHETVGGDGLVVEEDAVKDESDNHLLCHVVGHAHNVQHEDARRDLNHHRRQRRVELQLRRAERATSTHVKV